MNVLALRPLVSVVIPTYNRGYLIERTINSVLSQTYTNFELLIVDDASTDNTEQIISNIHDKRLNYIRLEQNTNGTKPRNIGIQNSKGDFIAFLDSDDEWLPNKLEKQLNFINQLNSEEFLCFTGLIKNNGVIEEPTKQRVLRNNEDIMDYILIEDNLVQTSTYMLPAKIAKKVEFNPTVKKHQDWDFCLRLKKQDVEFIYYPENLTVWNIDARDDRITSNTKYNYSLDWYNNSKSYLSKRAQYSFLAKIAANYYVLNKQKFKALGIYIRAYFTNAINLKIFIKGILKLIVPKKMLKYLFS